MIEASSSSLFLIGYRATGKSSVGKRIAHLSDLTHVDTDDAIEASLGISIAECFAEQGETFFRKEESACLWKLVERIRGGERLVVSTGGGIILSEENTRLMRDAGSVVWLKASADAIRKRLDSDPRTATSRPSLSGASAVDEVERVLSGRLSLYEGAAHAEFETDGQSSDAVAKAVLDWFNAGSGKID